MLPAGGALVLASTACAQIALEPRGRVPVGPAHAVTLLGATPVTGLAHHLNAVLRVEQGAGPGPDQDLIVSEHDPDPSGARAVQAGGLLVERRAAAPLACGHVCRLADDFL